MNNGLPITPFSAIPTPSLVINPISPSIVVPIPKPQLIDPIYKIKMVEALEKDNTSPYWKPSQKKLGGIYRKWIRPNWIVILLGIIFVIFLIWRYQHVKKLKSQEKFENDNYKYTEILDEKTKAKYYAMEPRIDTTKNQDKVDWAPYKDQIIKKEIDPFSHMDNGFVKPLNPYPVFPMKNGSFVPSKER